MADNVTNASQTILVEPSTGEKIVDAITVYGMKVIFAIVILVVGLWLAKKIRGLFRAALEKKQVDATLVGFFSSMLYGALVVFVVIAAISKLDVQTTSFVAVIGAAAWRWG